ncbi:MAG: leucine-rich repeat domain-containing protein, partial [bacterium]|nr:leucine-rich repeat domain-containing protein [bacterium]
MVSTKEMDASMRTVTVLIALAAAYGPAGAEPLMEGRVRLDSGEPVAGAQVLLFNLADLRAAPLAATTDGAGHFSLPLGGLRGAALPEGFVLGSNYPNPFNPSTLIPYQLPVPMRVRLEVFNTLGQRIATLVDGERPAGSHTAEWDATDASGQSVGAGVYLYRLSGDDAGITRSMLLIDGQAGVSMAGRAGVAPGPNESAELAPVYGLTVSRPGLVPYVDPAFRVTAGMAPVDLVVGTPTGAPRAKVTSEGILGDVDNTGRVDFFDALLVALYSLDPSVVMPNNGDVSLGDVNADGQVDLTDAWVIAAYLNDPSDPSLPSGIGEPVGVAAASLSPDPSTVAFADDGAWHRFTVEADEPVSVVVNPAGTPRGLEITTRSGRGNFCPAEADDDVTRRDGQAFYLSGCAAGEATVELRREDGTVLRSYSIEVSGSPADLVVESPSVSESTLRPGQSFTLSATVRNQGTGAASATTLNYYRSTNRTISTRDTQVGSDAVGALTASGSSSESIRLTAPSSGGTYYYGACVESVGGESSGNNCSAGVRITVEDLTPDLVVQAVSVSDSTLTPGESFTLSVTLHNQGSDGSAATTLRYFRSSNATISTRDTEVGTAPVEAMTASGSSTVSITPTAPSSEGTYYYGACVAAVAGEANTANNCSDSKEVTVQDGATRVIIPDANLRAAVEAALGKAGGAPITRDDMAALPSLWMSAAGISDLTGLESATNLTQLGLSNNTISDLFPLAGMTKLWQLELGWNKIRDVSALEGLTKMRHLSLTANEVADVTPLAGLTDLEDLTLGANGITDISALRGLTRLRLLHLWTNKIKDVSPLGELVNLDELELFFNDIADISSLSGLTNLRRLTLGYNEITDVSGLAGLTTLEDLDLRDNRITDISALAGMTGLVFISLENNTIEDVSALEGLTSLRWAELSFNRITDILALGNLANLEWLDLRGNPLNTASISTHVPALRNGGTEVGFAELRESDFDIELVFLDDFTEHQKRVLRWTAGRWMSVIQDDLPDYVPDKTWSYRCGGRSFEVPAGERIDDLRIYVAALEPTDYAFGRGHPIVLRESRLTAIGCMALQPTGRMLGLGLHEIGHVLGFGVTWSELGFLQDLSWDDPGADTHFNGPQAIAAFDEAGGESYTGEKVPVQKMDGSHWRSEVL